MACQWLAFVVYVYQITPLVPRARRRLHRLWRGTARYVIWMSAVSVLWSVCFVRVVMLLSKMRRCGSAGTRLGENGLVFKLFRDVGRDAACISEFDWCGGRDGACFGFGVEQQAAASECLR